MDINNILEVLKEPDVNHYLVEMSQIHMYTKHYLLIAEELSTEGVTFLQPLKEHRDAYDHICRILALSIKDNKNDGNDISVYILDNVKKAFGHEYRAFFDMADWFTYICRKYIREELSHKTIRKIYQEKFDDFEDTKEFINKLPLYVAKFREEKDVSNEQPILAEVLEYKKVMDKLLLIYQRIQEII